MEIQGYPNYLIYEDGRVWSIKRNKFLASSINTAGYIQIMPYNNGKRKTFRIHRLIAEHYIPNPNNLPCVDHINGDIKDNRIENLRWVSIVDNTRNTHKSRSNTGHQGVSYMKKKDKYQSYYYIDGVINKKYFKNLEDAIAWRKEMVDKYYNRPQSS